MEYKYETLGHINGKLYLHEIGTNNVIHLNTSLGNTNSSDYYLYLNTTLNCNNKNEYKYSKSKLQEVDITRQFITRKGEVYYVICEIPLEENVFIITYSKNDYDTYQVKMGQNKYSINRNRLQCQVVKKDKLVDCDKINIKIEGSRPYYISDKVLPGIIHFGHNKVKIPDDITIKPFHEIGTDNKLVEQSTNGDDIYRYWNTTCKILINGEHYALVKSNCKGEIFVSSYATLKFDTLQTNMAKLGNL